MEEINLQMSKDTKNILSPIEDPLIVGLQNQLTKLQVDAATAKSEFSELHPKVKILESQIHKIEAEMNRRIEESSEIEKMVPDQDYYQDLRMSLVNTLVNVVGLKAKLKTLSHVTEQLQHSISTLPSKQRELQSLMLIAGIAEERYKDLLEKLEEAQIEVEKTQGNATVIDMATEAEPILSRLVLFILSLLVSIGLAVAAGFTAEYLDNTLKTAEETTQHLDLALIGTIPKMKKNEDRLLRTPQEDSHLFEAFRKIRSGIKFASVELPIRTLLITSALRQEGKSLTVINLGIALSHMGKEVILVDADLRKPELHTILEMSGSSGLTNVLTGDLDLAQALQPTGIKGMSLLPAGPQPPNPVELLESQKMKKVIEILRSRDQIVLFDSPPVSHIADALVLAAELDAVLPVVEIGRTTREVSLYMKNQLVNAGSRLIGVILNKTPGEERAQYAHICA